MQTDSQLPDAPPGSAPHGGYARTYKCPQCGADVIQPRDSEDYCEECGWPDENRCEHPGIVERIRQWWWRRSLDRVLYRRMGLAASKAWKDRMFMEHYPQQTPQRALDMEFSD